MYDAGWPRIADVPGTFWNGARNRGGVIIDDLMLRISTASGGYDLAMRLAAFLSERAATRGGSPVVVTKAPTMWGGIKISRDAECITLTLSMTDYITATTRKWLPELVATGVLPQHVPKGGALQRLLDSLTLDKEGTGPLSSEQKAVQSITGDLRWSVRVLVRITKMLHRLSCVAARSFCPDAKLAALGVVAVAYHHRHEGLTYGGATDNGTFGGVLKGSVDPRKGKSIKKIDGAARLAQGAPVVLEGTVDATWSRGELGDADVYCLCLTHNGALIGLWLKIAGVICGSSAEIEGLGVLKLTDIAVYGRIAADRLNGYIDGPTRILCDAEAALRAASGETSVARLKHTLRRTAIVTQRVRNDEVDLCHIPDVANWVDIFTKWTKSEKVEAAIAYMTGALARALHADGQDTRLPAALMIISLLEMAHYH